MLYEYDCDYDACSVIDFHSRFIKATTPFSVSMMWYGDVLIELFRCLSTLDVWMKEEASH